MKNISFLIPAILFFSTNPAFAQSPDRDHPIPLRSSAFHADGGRHLRVFEPSQCPFSLPAGIRADCGFLVVPENRHDEEGESVLSPRKEIRIAVAIARAPSGSPVSDPIMYLTGGPSAAAITRGSIFYLSKLFFNSNRDLILVDQRGTGLSQPRLGCPEFDALAAAAFPNTPSRALYLDAVRRCRDRLRADGVDLDAYNSAENAADMDDLRVALGYDQWNVLGLSSGGLATLTLMRLYPEGIRSVVLDSPSSNDNLRVVDRWRTSNRLLEKVFTGCAADPVCAGRYADLRSVFYGLINRLQLNPVDVPIPNPVGGPPLTTHVTGDVLLSGTSSLVFDSAVLPSLPATIYFAAYGGLAQVVRAAAGVPMASSGVHADGNTLSTLCSDVIPFETQDDLNEAARAIPAFRDLILDPDALEPINRQACAIWGVSRAAAVQHHPVHSRIPTLILSGEYDGVVSPDEGARIANTLRRVSSIPKGGINGGASPDEDEETTNAQPQALFYQVPGVGHIVLNGTCASAIASQFLNHPEFVPNTSCLEALPKIVFGH